ncbi:hypothetical protein FB45DRAFT_1029642 [Roridomyces roridus]|uniref:C3H1-type domain-containing protein n=1 Tax=Roridomyces roridus TaxID=1738132 RepID=A0AAD7BQ62_9AGAR|nr:hypothetical protein FB45DRAFT_1029642 [Roridomyces roridus]
MSSSSTPTADLEAPEALDTADPVIVVLAPDTVSATVSEGALFCALPMSVRSGMPIPCVIATSRQRICISDDLKTVLDLDPENEAAKTALHDLQAAIAIPTPSDSSRLHRSPPYGLSARDDDKDSDTSDANHTGLGVPCLFYNHGGCARGNDCKFSHAADEKSAWAHIGKNVSLYLLLDACKFGDKCIYSHGRSYLPTNTKAAWWEDEARVAEIRARIDKDERDEEASKDKKRKNNNKNRRGPRHTRDGSMGSFGAPQFSPQHMVFPTGLGLGLPWIGGFSQYDVEDLAAQGVKPWDENAHDVLAALR